MNTILVNKIKKALKTKHQIETINEIISEYDEMYRLSEWRKKLLLDGNNLNEKEKELDKIAKIISNSDYYSPFCDDSIVLDMYMYFKKLRKK